MTCSSFSSAPTSNDDRSNASTLLRLTATVSCSWGKSFLTTHCVDYDSKAPSANGVLRYDIFVFALLIWPDRGICFGHLQSPTYTLCLSRGDKAETEFSYWRLREIFQGYSKEVSVFFFPRAICLVLLISEVLRLGVKGITLGEPGQNFDLKLDVWSWSLRQGLRDMSVFCVLSLTFCFWDVNSHCVSAFLFFCLYDVLFLAPISP